MREPPDIVITALLLLVIAVMFWTALWSLGFAPGSFAAYGSPY